MKTPIYFIIITIIGGVLMLNSCSKQTDNKFITQQNSYDVQSIISDLNSFDKGPGNWWQKIKKWFKDHTGTHLYPNCPYNNPCGPCPGLCLKLGYVNGIEHDSDELEIDDYAQGLRLFGLILVENNETFEEEIIFIFNKDIEDFIYENTFYFTCNIEAGTTITKALEKTSIIFHEGSYPVYFDSNTRYYYSLVNTTISN